ncbi:MAG: FHA domain-containing protein, partial [Longimicrobiales bacterium]
MLRGARAGEVIDFTRESIRVGRDPDAELCFHPDADLEVSGGHALLFRVDAGWFLRDLGSTNGTRLNGRQITGDERVADGDRIEFGAGGPLVQLRFHAVADASASRTSVLRAFYAGRQRRLRGIAIALGAALVLAAAGLVVIGDLGRRQRTAWQGERAMLLARIDTLLSATDRTAGSLRGERDELAD